MICRDDLPPTPDWSPEPHACPFTQGCGVCESAQAEVWLHGSDAHLLLGEN